MSNADVLSLAMGKGDQYLQAEEVLIHTAKSAVPRTPRMQG